MKKTFVLAILSIIGFSFTRTVSLTQASSEIPYPEAYRSWVHIKTKLVGPQNPAFATVGGFQHIYGNPLALKGLQTGQFEDGASFVFDVIAAVDKNGNTIEGERRHIDVMVKNKVLYAETGGWGFEEFNGNSKTERMVGDAAVAKCFSCHQNRKEKGFVFCSYRE